MLLAELKHAARSLRTRPSFTIVALLSLALGIGANSAIFSFVYSVLLAPLPYPNSDRMILLQETVHGKRTTASAERWKDWLAQSDTIAAITGYYSESMTWMGREGAERVEAMRSYGDPLAVYGLQPATGRNFTADELNGKAPAAAILSHAFWQTRFGGGAAIGQQIVLNNKSFTIVGIMPASWKSKLQAIVPETTALPRSARFLRQMARLQPNVSFDQAQARLNVTATNLEKQYPDTDKDLGVQVIPLQQDITGSAKTPLLVLLGAVGFVLMSACLNIASLLLYRATSRRREIAVRLAIGASRWQVARLLLSEGLLLGLIGGALGLLFALWGVDLLKQVAPETLPRLSEVRLSWPVALFAAVVSLITALLCSLAPALETARTDLNDAIKNGGRIAGRRHWMQSTLVVAEVGISLALLIGAGLLMRSFWNLQSRPLGFSLENRVSFQVPQSWQTDPAKVHAFTEEVLRSVRSMPGIDSAEFTDRLPMEGGSSNYNVATASGRELPPGPSRQIDQRMISPGYLGEMGVALKAGRFLSDDDTKPGVRRAVINEGAARVFFGDQNPVGQTMRLVFSSNKDKGTEWEIVGVTGSLPKTATELESDPAMYIPHQKSFWPIGEFVVKGSLPPTQLYSAIRQAVARVDRQQVVENLRTLDKVLDEQVAQPRLNAWLVGVFATAALVLAAMGIYGLLSNTVMHRAQEIGIRMALGARQSSIVALVIWQVLPLLATGLTLGLAAAWFLKGLLGKLLFGLKPTDPLSLVGSTGLLLVAALAACYIPARRASRLDPIRVLRNE